AQFLAHQHRDTYVYTVADTQHFNFSDLGVWFFAPPFRQLLGVAGPIPGDTALRITNAYLTVFFAHALLHQQATLLTNPSPAYPQVRYVSVEPP
ncbi:MAG: hypothetical protein ACRDQ5_11525, partial [Sciscionella sp.]